MLTKYHTPLKAPERIWQQTLYFLCDLQTIFISHPNIKEHNGFVCMYRAAVYCQTHQTRQTNKMVMTTRMMTITPPPTAPAIIAIITLPTAPASWERERERRERSFFKPQVSLKYCKSCWMHLLELTFLPPPPVRSQSPQQLPQTVPLPPPFPSWTCQETEHSLQRSTPCNRQCPVRRGAAKRHSWLPSLEIEQPPLAPDLFRPENTRGVMVDLH